MKLKEAYELLREDGTGDNHRLFAEVFKHYNFTEDQELKDYLDFICHEPVEWMRGFPARLTTKAAFARPKTAMIKLLKQESVKTDLGDTYVAQVHQKIWDTYKSNADKVMVQRVLNSAIEHKSPPMFEGIEIEPPQSLHLDEFESLEEKDQTEGSNQEDPQDKERIRVLKEALLKMSSLLPDGASDAFRLLVSRV